MTETIREQILQNVETSLLLADGGSSGSDYFFDIGTGHVHRADVSMTQIETGPFPLLAIAGVESREVSGAGTAGDAHWIEEMDLEIGGWIADQTNVDRDLSRLEHDIRRALWTDPYRGGLAIITLWNRTEIVHPLTTEDRALVVCYFTVRYEVKLSDLTSTIP